MKTRILTAIGAIALATVGAGAQSAYDAYSLVPTQLRGTARFVAMGGAFTSLGGDLSSMTQNPAGLGLYRSSDVGVTVDISARKFHATTNTGKTSASSTPFSFDNVGYVGVANLNGTLRAFQWGVSYNRIASYDRITSGYVNPSSGSLSNYIAGYTQGVNSSDLLDADGYDPYFDSDQDWLSVLAYNSYMINNNGSNTSYAGLYKNGTVGDALFHQRERGYMDEYNIDFAANISDIVFVGLGVGIVDVSKTIEANYSESMSGAEIYDTKSDRLTTGNAGYNLYNYQHIDGSGANFKFGVVVRPIEMLRIGAAVHTPTYLHLSHNGYGQVNYNYTPDGTEDTNSDKAWTPDYDYRSRLRTPWRFMVGASLVIGPKAIISVDYERVAYNDMKLKQQVYYNSYDYPYNSGSFEDNKFANDDIKADYKGADILRVGAEFRALPFLSIRAGYNWQGSAVKSKVYDGGTEVFTSGTNPAYSFDNDTHSISFGLGFRYRAWYLDLTYQHVRQTGVYKAFTPSAWVASTPTASLSRDYNNVVISTGIRF